MIANSGRFKNTLKIILNGLAFDSFMQLRYDIYQTVGSTWKISLKREFVLIFDSLKVRDDIVETVLF